MSDQDDQDRLEEIEHLRNSFDHYLREATRERKRGRADSEESLRNKASALAVQIIAKQARFIEHWKAVAAGYAQENERLKAALNDAGAVLAGVSFRGESCTCPECGGAKHSNECRLDRVIGDILAVTAPSA